MNEGPEVVALNAIQVAAQMPTETHARELAEPGDIGDEETGRRPHHDLAVERFTFLVPHQLRSELDGDLD